jgi:hypothetical protein
MMRTTSFLSRAANASAPAPLVAEPRLAPPAADALTLVVDDRHFARDEALFAVTRAFVAVAAGCLASRGACASDATAAAPASIWPSPAPPPLVLSILAVRAAGVSAVLPPTLLANGDGERGRAGAGEAAAHAAFARIAASPPDVVGPRPDAPGGFPAYDALPLLGRALEQNVAALRAAGVASLASSVTLVVTAAASSLSARATGDRAEAAVAAGKHAAAGQRVGHAIVFAVRAGAAAVARVPVSVAAALFPGRAGDVSAYTVPASAVALRRAVASPLAAAFGIASTVTLALRFVPAGAARPALCGDAAHARPSDNAVPAAGATRLAPQVRARCDDGADSNGSTADEPLLLCSCTSVSMRVPASAALRDAGAAPPEWLPHGGGDGRRARAVVARVLRFAPLATIDEAWLHGTPCCLRPAALPGGGGGGGPAAAPRSNSDRFHALHRALVLGPGAPPPPASAAFAGDRTAACGLLIEFEGGGGGGSGGGSGGDGAARAVLLPSEADCNTLLLRALVPLAALRHDACAPTAASGDIASAAPASWSHLARVPLDQRFDEALRGLAAVKAAAHPLA